MITENLSTLKIHKLTQEQYNRELEAGRIDENALYLTPDEAKDLNAYATLNYVDATYESKDDAVEKLAKSKDYTDEQVAVAKAYTDSAMLLKADLTHSHDDVYCTEAYIDERADVINLSINNIVDGTTVVAKSEESNRAITADSATHATTSDSASVATAAISAEKATKDGNDNTITSTYETKTDASAKLEEAKIYSDANLAEAKSYVDTRVSSVPSLDAYTKTEVDAALEGKADISHRHDSDYDAAGSADDALASAQSYTDSKISGLASASIIDTKISTHNTSTSAHDDIRALIVGLNTKLNNFLDVDDATVDQLSEVITLIENNKGTLESLTTNKVNVADIVNNLTTNSAGKVLSAAQGVAIKALIDALQSELDGHTHAISDVSGLQSALDGKAASSHGTHVSYSTTAPVMDGTASVGTAGTVARSDHKHPTDTSRASKTEFDAHASDATKHITSTERSNWGTAYTHSQAAHAPSNAEANQNAFSNIVVGSTTIAADSKTDTLTLVGSNVTLTPDATNDKVTIAVADGSTSAKGIVQLTNSTSSTSTTTAATPSSVKSAYDLANTAKTNAATAQARADSAYTLAEGKVDNLSDLGITATAIELNYMDGVTSNVQTQLNNKFNTSGGTINGITTVTAQSGDTALKVKSGSDESWMDFINNSNVNLGYLGFSAQNVPAYYPGSGSGAKSLLHSGNYTSYAAAKDHTHTISNITNLQSSLDAKAAQTSLDSHTADTAVHITASERTNWNAAKTHADSAHAPSNAQPNQNAFSNVKVGSTTIAADTTTDTLTLVAGTNVILTPDANGDSVTISATDTNTTYSAGTGISLSGTTFSNSGVRSVATGSTNGTISVNTNGTSAEVAVKGLGSAAYTASTAYDAAGAANTALTNAKAYTDSVASGKAASSHTHNYAGSSSAGGAATSANKVNSSLTVKLNSGTTEGTNMFTFNGGTAKTINITPSAIGAQAAGSYAASSHTHDDRYYTESEIDNKLSGKANSSHGNHVPATQTASNSVFLRNDNTWATVTPANIGAAAVSHGTHVSYGTSATAIGATAGAGSASTVSRSDHTHSLSKSAVTTALGYTPPTSDTNTTYTVATGDSNGQIKVTPSGGSAYNVSVKGLGSAAYTNSTAYDAAGAANGALNSAKSYTDTAVATRAPSHTWSTADVVAGSASTEPNGTLHLVIE